MINKPDIEEQIPDDCTYMMNLKLKEAESRMLVIRGWWWVNWGDDGHVVKVSLMQNE